MNPRTDHTRPSYDDQLITAAEVYRDRLVAQAEAEGFRVIDCAARMCGANGDRIDFRAWDWRTGEPLVDYIGWPADLPAERAAAGDDGTWKLLAEIIVAASDQAVRTVPEPHDA